MEASGMSPNAPQRVYEECQAAGLSNVVMQTYTVENKRYLWPAARKWLDSAFSTLVLRSILRSGKAQNEVEARGRTAEVMERYERYCQDGVPLVFLTVVLGQNGPE